ncbi:MAG: L,D-transpeptidase [Bradyrhizobium sp.]|nr:L,D-transpeptidase [Bradyrhizobium sp.]
MKRLSQRRLARLAFAAVAVTAGLALTPALAGVVVRIDKSSQRMAVSVDGTTRHSWPVSTGRRGYGTPSGVFRPQMMARRWFSRKYYNSPMPHAIFFHRGYAIHGTYELARLGGLASHGCVRLHPANAAALFALVERRGRHNTRIVISN